VLSGHDADGAAGINGAMNRWYGGMVHELGHAFGLPDATSTDGTCMSASLYSYPNSTFQPDPEERHPQRSVRQLPVLTPRQGGGGKAIPPPCWRSVYGLFSTIETPHRSVVTPLAEYALAPGGLLSDPPANLGVDVFERPSRGDQVGDVDGDRPPKRYASAAFAPRGGETGQHKTAGGRLAVKAARISAPGGGDPHDVSFVNANVEMAVSGIWSVVGGGQAEAELHHVRLAVPASDLTTLADILKRSDQLAIGGPFPPVQFHDAMRDEQLDLPAEFGR
jgi:hypothetical protein